MTSPRSHWLLLIVAAFAGPTAACRRSPSPGPSPDGGRTHDARNLGAPAAIATSRPDAAPPADDRAAAQVEGTGDTDRYQAWFCRARRCCVTAAWPAGRNRRGRALTVVAVQDGQRCGAQEEEAEAGAGAPEPEIDPQTCTDYWLVTDAGKGEKRPAKRRLDAECEGDKWESSVEVDLKEQTFSASGHSLFSNTRTDKDLVIGLDPLRVISEQEGSLSVSHSRDESWNWDLFAGTLELGVDYCPNKAPPDAGIEQDRDAPVMETAAIILPRVTVPAAFADGGWRTVRLGRCAAHVDGADNGFAVFGGKGSARDASMRLVLSADRDLYVQLDDDHLVTSAKSWVKQDHLELWIAAQPPECIDPTTPSPALQWGIGVPDGQLFPAFGDPPAAPVVTAHRAGRTVRLKIALGALLPDDARITVAYSDSDDGVRQKRVIATSSLAYGRWWTLGQVRDIDAAQATCIVKRGALEPQVKGFSREQ